MLSAVAICAALGLVTYHARAQAPAGGQKPATADPYANNPDAGKTKFPLAAPAGKDSGAKDKPLPGAGAPNPGCAGAERRRADTSDNSASVGMLFTFGSFRFLDLGDLTQDLEFDLACPVNRIGEVDLYLTTHHGSQLSNAKVLVHALNAQVAVMTTARGKAAICRCCRPCAVRLAWKTSG
jgi:hypothetical protein